MTARSTVQRWAIAVTILWAGLVAISIVLVSRMKPQTSIEGLLDASDPSVAAMSRVLTQFPATEEQLVFVTLPLGQSDSAPLIAFAQRLEQATAKEPQLFSSLNYKAGESARAFIEREVVPAGMYYLDADARARLLQRLTPQGIAEQLQRDRDAMAAPGVAAGEVAKQVLKDPLWLHDFLIESSSRFQPPWGGKGDTFLSRDGRSLLIRIEGAKPPRDLEFCAAITKRIHELSDTANVDHLDVQVSGAYAIAAWSAQKIRADSIEGTIFTTVGLGLLLLLLLRRPFVHSLLMLIPAIAGIGVGFGAYAIITPQFTPLSAVVGGALGGIGIDYSVQFLARYIDERRRAGGNAAAVRATLRGYLGPLTTAWLTTLIGFISIALSSVRLLRDFSVLGSLTLLGSFAATLTLLPALLILLDHRPAPTLSRGGALVRRLSVQLAQRPRRWVVGMLVLCAVLLCVGMAGMRNWAMDSDLTVLHPRPDPPLEAQRLISSRMGLAGGSVFIYLRGDSPRQLLERAYALDRRMDDPSLRDAGAVARFGLPSLLPDPQSVASVQAELKPGMPEQVGNDLRAGLVRFGFRADRFDAYIGFAQRLVTPSDAPDASTLLRYPDWSRILLSREALAGAAPTEAISLVFFSKPLEGRAFRTHALDALRQATAGLEGVTLTGLAPITQDVERDVEGDFVRLFGVAFSVVFAYLVVYFRSFTQALVAMIPTAVGLCALAAFISISGQKFNLVTVVMLPLLLGVNIDYGIYAVAAWRKGRSRVGLSRQFRALTPAIVLSCFATVIGFGSLVKTSLPAVQLLGALIIVGVTACLAGTMLLTWPLLLWHRARRGPARG